MENVRILLQRRNNIEDYCMKKYHAEYMHDEDKFESLLSYEIEVLNKKLLRFLAIIRLLRKNDENVLDSDLYICSKDEVPHDAIYKGYVTVCEEHPGVVTYFRVIFKVESTNKFYICDSYTFVPMR